jgi:hypothetical protein
MKKRTSGKAIASLILGMIFPFAVSNILFGVPSFKQMKNNRGQLTRRWRAAKKLEIDSRK